MTGSLNHLPNKWYQFSVRQLVIDHALASPMDGNHGEIHPKSSDFTEDGIPFIMASDVSGGRILYESCKKISKTQADSLRKGFSITGDILLTHKATLGRTAIVGEMDYPYIMLTPQVTYYRIKDCNIIHNKYLKYYFESPNFQAQLINHGDSGSTRAYVGITAQLELPIVLPPLPEQKAIAAVLSSLDDKIDLLHRQNATLEAMAETFFRQWFVVEAKEEWEEKSLSSIANFLNGLPCQKYTPENDIDKLPVLKIRELNSGINNSSDWATSDVPCEYIVENGDVIFSWSASLMVKIWPGEQCVLNQHLFKVTSANYPKWFYFMWCKKHLAEFISISESHATTMGHIKRGDLDTAIVLVPTTDELSKMTKHISPIIDKHIINNQQLNTLLKLRNTLLPKLMSGEVRVNY